MLQRGAEPKKEKREGGEWFRSWGWLSELVGMSLLIRPNPNTILQPTNYIKTADMVQAGTAGRGRDKSFNMFLM